MRIGIIGYGRMGHEIKIESKKRNHSISFTVDPHSPDSSHNTITDINETLWNDTDVIIEFSLANAVKPNASVYASHHLPSIIGSTGWDSDIKNVSKIIEKYSTSSVYGANFSIGAHVFARLSEKLACFINNLPYYDIGVWEIHHNKKKDRPSGTALMTAHKILSSISRKTDIITTIPENVPMQDHQLSVVSQRIGYERGFHEVIVDSDFDTIKLSHSARSRTGFALGAIMAAEWIVATKDKNKGLICVDTFIDNLLQ